MGKTPNKHSTDGENNSIKYAASSMKGAPAEMEDAHTIILQVNGTSDSFFGVYDGDGGAEVALYCSRQFHIELSKHSEYSGNLPAAMKGACTRIDEKLKQSDDWKRKDYPPGIGKLIRHLGVAVCAVKWPWKTPYLGPLQVGSTACVTVVRDNQITVGNIGDTRCVLSMRGQGQGQGQVGEVIDISADHKPQDEAEEKRIVMAGGKVYKEESPNAALKDLRIYRIDGKLHISRAIGYFQFKQDKTLDDSQQMVTSDLDTSVVKKTDSIEFLLIASRGIWTVMTSQEAVESVCESLQSAKSLRASCEELLDKCMRLGSKENLTVILIQFKSDRQGEFQANSNQGTEDPSDSESDKASHNDDPRDKKDGIDDETEDPSDSESDKASHNDDPRDKKDGIDDETEDPSDSESDKASHNDDPRDKKDGIDEDETEDPSDSESGKASHNDDPQDKDGIDEDEEKIVVDPGNRNTGQESPPPPPPTLTVASFAIQGKPHISDKGSKGCFNMKGLGFKGCFQGWLNHEKDVTAASGNHKRSDSPSPVKILE